MSTRFALSTWVALGLVMAIDRGHHALLSGARSPIVSQKSRVTRRGIPYGDR